MNQSLELSESIPEKYKVSVNALHRFLNEINSKELAQHQLDFSDVNKWKFETISSWSHIAISEKSLDILWCYSLAYFDYYRVICLGVKPSGQEISLKNSEELNEGIIAIVWATKNLTESSDDVDAFPEEIRRPVEYETLNPESPEYLFETALAFYYLHEVGHIQAKDEHFQHVIDEEIYCDNFAIENLLNNCNDAELKWRKRGIALGLTLMNVIGMHTGFYDGKEHPFAYDRITSVLDKKIEKTDDDLWGWVVALFALHMTENKIKQPTTEFEDFRETVEEYRKILEKHKEKSA